MARINGTEGTVTISLREYNRLKGHETSLKKFTSEPDTVMIHVGPYYEDSWWVIRPGEAIVAITDHQKREIERLKEIIKKADDKPHPKKSWWQRFWNSCDLDVSNSQNRP